MWVTNVQSRVLIPISGLICCWRLLKALMGLHMHVSPVLPWGAYMVPLKVGGGGLISPRDN